MNNKKYTPIVGLEIDKINTIFNLFCHFEQSEKLTTILNL